MSSRKEVIAWCNRRAGTIRTRIILPQDPRGRQDESHAHERATAGLCLVNVVVDIVIRGSSAIRIRTAMRNVSEMFGLRMAWMHGKRYITV